MFVPQLTYDNPSFWFSSFIHEWPSRVAWAYTHVLPSLKHSLCPKYLCGGEVGIGNFQVNSPKQFGPVSSPFIFLIVCGLPVIQNQLWSLKEELLLKLAYLPHPAATARSPPCQVSWVKKCPRWQAQNTQVQSAKLETQETRMIIWIFFEGTGSGRHMGLILTEKTTRSWNILDVTFSHLFPSLYWQNPLQIVQFCQIYLQNQHRKVMR